MFVNVILSWKEIEKDVGEISKGDEGTKWMKKIKKEIKEWKFNKYSYLLNLNGSLPQVVRTLNYKGLGRMLPGHKSVQYYASCLNC